MGRTEYDHAFKSQNGCYAKIYEGNVDYRLHRREVEHHHNHDVFTWDDEPSDSDSEVMSTAGVTKQTPRPASVPPHVYKHQMLNKAYENRLRRSQPQVLVSENGLIINGHSPSNDAGNGTQQNIPKKLSNGVLDPDPEPQILTLKDLKIDVGDKHDKGSQQVHCSKSSNVSDSPTSKAQDNKQGPQQDQKLGQGLHRKRPKKPKQSTKYPKKFVPKPRPMSAPLGRSLPKQESVDMGPGPFIPYGFRDREVETGTKRTHNIRASAEVYPSALRAMRRKKVDIGMREENAKKAPYREKRKQALFNDFDEKMKRETANWGTEYRNHFLGFGKAEYQRNLSARPAFSRASDRNEIGQGYPDVRSSW